MGDEPGSSKIHVDSDWKAEAQEAKERLAAEERAAEAEMRAPGQEITPGLADLINIIATPAALGMGGYKTPDGQVIPPDFSLAKYHIDVLGVLEEKTKGNLSDDEAKMLKTVLHQLRMQFTEIVAAATAAPPPPAKS
jgi:hypothetical protein